jgi:pentatricopeptide repeat protein
MSTLAAATAGDASSLAVEEDEEDWDLALEACAGGHEAEAEVALDMIRQASRGHRQRADGAEEGGEDRRGGREEGGEGPRGPSVAGLASAVSACAKAGRVEEGLMLLHRLEQREGTQEGGKLARALYAPLIAACARAQGETAANTALLLLQVSRRELARSRG